MYFKHDDTVYSTEDTDFLREIAYTEDDFDSDLND